MGTNVFKKGDQMSVEAKNAKQLIIDEIKAKFRQKVSENFITL